MNSKIGILIIGLMMIVLSGCSTLQNQFMGQNQNNMSQATSIFYGNIVSYENQVTQKSYNPVGAILGGALGGFVGNQFGHNRGRAALTGVGIVGGALAGNHMANSNRVSERLVAVIRLDCGYILRVPFSSIMMQTNSLVTGVRVLVRTQSGHLFVSQVFQREGYGQYQGVLPNGTTAYQTTQTYIPQNAAYSTTTTHYVNNPF